MVPYVLKFQSSEFFDSYQKIFTGSFKKKVPFTTTQP